MPSYIELDTDAELERFEEWLGRKYIASLGESYPSVPDWWGPGRQPEDPSVVVQRFYRYGEPKEDDGSGGVVEVDDWMLTLPASTETLDDGTTYSVDVTKRKRALLLLSAKGRRAVTGIVQNLAGQVVRRPMRERKRRRERNG